jgi:hypothetical protein
MARSRLAVIACAVLLGLPALGHAQARLQVALELYSAASYDDALAALDELAAADLPEGSRAVVAQHRMLCLMALGRTAAAERAATELLSARPDFTLAARDASPRVRALFDATRRRVLPEVVRQRYAEARRAFDAGDQAAAHRGFRQVASVLLDPQIAGADPALGDLRTLADGFVVLTAGAADAVPGDAALAAPAPSTPAAPAPEPAASAAVAPVPAAPAPSASDTITRTTVVDDSASLVSFPTDPAVSWRGEGSVTPDPAAAPAADADAVAAPAASPVVEPAPAPVSTPAAPAPAPLAPTPAASAPAAPTPSAATPEPAAASPRASEPAPFAPIGIFTYDWRNKDVTPPVPIAQAVSGWWGRMGEPTPGTQLGAIEVVVDEQGRVADARIYLSVNRVYDAVLLESAKNWRYQPATRGGRPVKYRRITGVVSGR